MDYIYISKIINKDIIDKIYSFTKFIGKEYLDYNNWFFNVNLQGIYNGTREIIICMDNDKIIGTIFLKNEKDEKKICTLYVDKKYRKQGIGSKLLGLSFKYLKTKTPVISFSRKKLYMFKKYILKYNWKLTRETDDFELIFNEK